MRAVVFVLIILTSLPCSALGAPRISTARDCIRETEYGDQEISAFRSQLPDGKHLFLTAVGFKNNDGRYDSESGNATEETLKNACDYVLETASERHPPVEGWSIDGATVERVPDKISQKWWQWKWLLLTMTFLTSK